MNILHVIPYMHPNAGGPPVVADRFCQELKSCGHRVSVITTDALSPADDSDWTKPFEQRYDFTTLPSLRKNAFGYSRQLKPLLKKRVREFDLVHIHNLWSYMNIATSKACRKFNVPYVVSTHGMLDPNSLSRKSLKKKWYGRLIEFPQLRRANGMIYTHEEELALANSSCSHLPPGYVIPLGADEPVKEGITEAKADIMKMFPTLAGKKLILFFGRIHPKKGLDLLIPAMAMLSKKMPDAHLVLAGPIDNSYREKIDRLIKEHQLESQITFTGAVYDARKWALLSLSDTFVLPSYQENFAITVAEALRVGLPVVLSKHVNIWKDIVSAQAGISCQLDPADIASKLEQVLSDEDLHRKLSENGPTLVERQFTWKVAGVKLLESYQQVLASK
ncbi:MAG: glycosyltransferase [Gimesia sp.]